MISISQRAGASWRHGVAIFSLLSIVTTPLLAAEPGKTAAGHPAEGQLKAFLGEPSLEIQQIHRGGRFANSAVAVDGTVLAVITGVKLRRSEDGGKTWGPDITVGKGFMGGGITVNENNGEIFAFVEDHHPPAKLTVYSSKDHGKSWSKVDAEIKPDSKGNVPAMHMNEHGITLRHGTTRLPRRSSLTPRTCSPCVSSTRWIILRGSYSSTISHH